MKQTGFLENGTWTKFYVKEHFPSLIGQDGKINSIAMLSLNQMQQSELGRVIFQYHCNDCHAKTGLSGIKELTRGWTTEMMESLVLNMEKAHYFMPPWCGTNEEAKMLVQYMHSVQDPQPGGMKYSHTRETFRKISERRK